MTQQRLDSFWKRLFINRDYGLLFMGRLVSQIGDGIGYFALTWLVLDLTGSGAALGTLLLVSSLPSVLLAPFTGVLADMWDRKTIIVSMDIVRGLVILAMAAIHYTGHLTIGVLYGTTIILSLCGVLFGPAVSAAIPGMVKREELTAANARNNFSRSATGIIGPVVGAFLLAATGYTGVFLINGFAFLASAVSEMFIRFPQVKQDMDLMEGSGSGPFARFVVSFKEGFRYIWTNAGLRTLILFAVVLNFLTAPLFNVVFPFFGKEVLQMQAEHYGLTQSSLPAGLLLGTLIITWLSNRFRKDRLLVSGIIGQGMIIAILSVIALPAVYGGMSSLALMFALAIPILVMGVLNIQVNVPFQVMLQETVPDGFRGRVFGLLDSMVQIFVPISMALFGVAVDVIPPVYFFLICGLISVGVGMAMGLSSSIAQMYGPVQSRSERPQLS